MKLMPLSGTGAVLFFGAAVFAATDPRPDLTIAADGSGDFKTIQSALASIPKHNRERRIVLLKKGTYNERLRLDSSFVTLRGEGREGTRIEFHLFEEETRKNLDPLGSGLLNINGNDCVVESLTVLNHVPATNAHAFAVYGKGNRTIFVNCDLLSGGTDTVAIWGGKTNNSYFKGCKFRGTGNIFCPRGWSAATDCSFDMLAPGPAVWHDGSRDPDMKLVVRGGKFDGVEGWLLGRHHVDAQFYFLDCAFSKTMSNSPPVHDSSPENQKKAGEDPLNRRGERAYYHQCRREGGDYDWFRNNLSTAAGNPTPDQVTTAWIFGGKWDPEQAGAPAIEKMESTKGIILVIFTESVTVKGKPRIQLRDGTYADYLSGSGLHTLQFKSPTETPTEIKALELNDGAILASDATATLRMARLDLPSQR